MPNNRKKNRNATHQTSESNPNSGSNGRDSMIPAVQALLQHAKSHEDKEINNFMNIEELMKEISMGKTTTSTNKKSEKLKRKGKPKLPTEEACGSVTVYPSETGPNSSISVIWNLPSPLPPLITNVCKRRLQLGLFREGQHHNDNPLVSRNVHLASRGKTRGSNRGKGMKSAENLFDQTTGKIQLRSPKSPGTYEFRIYCLLWSDSDDEDENEVLVNITLSHSNPLVVGIQGDHVRETLDGINKRLHEDDGIPSGMLQISRLVEQLHTIYPNDLQFLCNMILQKVDPVFSMLNKNETTEEDVKNLRRRRQEEIYTHNALRIALRALETNPIVYQGLPENIKQYFYKLNKDAFCLTSELFFTNEKLRQDYWMSEFKFPPVPRDAPSNITESKNLALSKYLMNRSKLTMPDDQSFYQRRILVRNRLLDLIPRLNWTHGRISLEIFGSSYNNFGTTESDLDMSLVVPNASSTSEVNVLASLSKLIQEHHNTEVEERLSARIPIITFTDPTTGLQVDICVNNLLAVRNTGLLRAYSIADPRIRPLAYLLKEWSKKRNINSPSDGTLSSYGYLLMLISYLQRLEPPVLPVLQQIPPTWTGEPCTNFNSSSLPTVPFPTISGKTCETYFYDPVTPIHLQSLRVYGSRNTMSIGQLFTGFFRSYSTEVDCSYRVISIRSTQDVLVTEKQKGEHAWKQVLSNRFKVEDPFEQTYDVAHVLKDSSNRSIRREFSRAYHLLYESDENNMEGVMSELFEAADANKEDKVET